MTREVIKAIQASAPAGEPIISASPWTFYEAVFYNTARNPIYFLDDNVKNDMTGSIDMLRYSDNFKIKDLNEFVKVHPKVWYTGYSADGPLTPPISTWKEIQKFSIFDNITNKDPYKAAEFQTN